MPNPTPSSRNRFPLRAPSEAHAIAELRLPASQLSVAELKEKLADMAIRSSVGNLTERSLMEYGARTMLDWLLNDLGDRPPVIGRRPEDEPQPDALAAEFSERLTEALVHEVSANG